MHISISRSTRAIKYIYIKQIKKKKKSLLHDAITYLSFTAKKQRQLETRFTIFKSVSGKKKKQHAIS